MPRLMMLAAAGFVFVQKGCQMGKTASSVVLELGCTRVVRTVLTLDS